MTEGKKPAFPQTPDGVTDWERVFEEPNGLIELVSMAKTEGALRECGLVIIKMLFTRKQDELEVKRLINSLDRLIAKSRREGSFKTLKAQVIAMLRHIKTERIQKANAYVRRRKLGKGRNRRSGSPGGALARFIYRLINDPKFSVTVGAIALVLLLGVFSSHIDRATLSALFGPQRAPDSEETGQDRQQAQAIDLTEKETEKSDVKGKNPKKKKTESDASPKMPPALALERVYVPPPKGSKKGGGRVLPIIVVNDRGRFGDLCQIRPVLYDLLNTSFIGATRSGRELVDGDYAKIAAAVKKTIDKRLGANTVRSVVLARGAHHRDMGTKKCAYAPDRFIKYLPKNLLNK